MYYATNFKRLVSQLNHDATILIYCQRGRQGPMARRVMEQLRFTDLRVLQGGVHAWQEAGQPLVW